jgi:hypothetical protein
MTKYRKIQLTNYIISYDSDIDSGLIGRKFPDEINFLETVCFTKWELVTIVDDHKTFIFKEIK